MNSFVDKLTSFIGVKPEEKKIFWPIALGKFFVLLNYTIFRDMKDALIASRTGVEVVPFLKGVIVFMSSLIGFYIYGILASRFSQKNIFTLYSIIFGSFFAIFGAFLYPNIEQVTLTDDTIQNLTSFISLHLGEWAVPSRLLLAMKYWPIVIFYVLAELWGAFFVFFMWHLANALTNSESAKMLYPKFAIVSNSALIVAGTGLWSLLKFFPSPVDEMINSKGKLSIEATYIIFTVITLSTFAMWYCYQSAYELPRIQKGEGSKLKLSFFGGFKTIIQNTNLLWVALMVLCYGACMGLLDTSLKKQLEIYSQNKDQGYIEWVSLMSAISGVFVILLVSLTQNALKIFGWRRIAMVTPIIVVTIGGSFLLLGTLVGFFGFQREEIIFSGLCTVGTLLVVAGSMQNVLSKGCKYVLFDPTKEISFINMDRESKSRGKAAVDIVGGRTGKASGSYMIMSLLGFFCNDLIACLPYILCLVGALSGIWIYSVVQLSKSDLIQELENNNVSHDNNSKEKVDPLDDTKRPRQLKKKK